MRLEHKVAVITGAGRGVGRKAAEEFSREGASLIISDVNMSVFEVAEDIRKSGGNVVAVQCDVAESKEVKAMFETVYENYGGLDIIFNNAGIMPAEDGCVVDTDEKIWNRVININVKSIFLCCKYGIPMMVQRGGGSVINMGSITSLVGCTVPQDAYTASKGAIHSLSRSLAVQFGEHNIRVNTLSPGPLETPLTAHILKSEDERKKRLQQIPMRRFGHLDDVVYAAIYLASDESSWTTGTCMIVDGGLTINYF